MATAVDDTISFVTLAEAVAHVDLPEGEVDQLGKLAECVNAAARAIEVYCARVLRQRSIDMDIDCDGTSTAFAHEWPIAQSPAPIIWSDSYSDFTTAALLTYWPGTGSRADYDVRINWDTGEITAQWSAFWRGDVTLRVRATVGYAPSAAQDLKQAQLILVASFFGMVGRDPNVTNEAAIGISKAFDLTAALPDQVATLLGPYCRPACIG